MSNSFGITSEYHINLKSCPFCGHEAWLTHVKFNDGDTWYHPECSNCKCGWQENYETKEEAVEEWNKRK